MNAQLLLPAPVCAGLLPAHATTRRRPARPAAAQLPPVLALPATTAQPSLLQQLLGSLPEPVRREAVAAAERVLANLELYLGGGVINEWTWGDAALDFEAEVRRIGRVHLGYGRRHFAPWKGETPARRAPGLSTSRYSPWRVMDAHPAEERSLR